MTNRTIAKRLAAKLGCTLEYRRTRHAIHVTIYLPASAEFDANPGLDVLHHECELDEDIWPGVLGDLEVIAS